MLFKTKMTDEEIEIWISKLPNDDKSHPLPFPQDLTPDSPLNVVKNIEIILTDLGQGVTCTLPQSILLVHARLLAQYSGKPPTVEQFSAYSLRAPEVILGGDFSSAVDIWAIGCLVTIFIDFTT